MNTLPSKQCVYMFIFQNGRMEFLDSGLYTWSLKTTNLEIFSTLKFVDKFLLPLEVYHTAWTKEVKDTNPLMSSSLVILFWAVKKLCRFQIWSETECKTPAEYGPQYISTPPPPHSHTLSVYTVHWEGGGRGRRSERRYSRGATLNSTQV